MVYSSPSFKIIYLFGLYICIQNTQHNHSFSLKCCYSHTLFFTFSLLKPLFLMTILFLPKPEKAIRKLE